MTLSPELKLEVPPCYAEKERERERERGAQGKGVSVF